MAPALNRYIQDKFPKEYKGSGVYAELAKQLDDFLSQGEKGTKLTYKYICKTAMARLAQYEYLPPGLLRILVGFFYSEDKRVARCAFYMAQRLLGPGAAGTPIPAPPGNDLFLPSLELKKADLAKAWQDVTRTEANPMARDFQLRMMAAAARAHPDCVTLLGDTIKGMLVDCGVDPKAKKSAAASAGPSPRVEPGARSLLLKSAFCATRAALPGKPSTFTLVAKRAFHGVDSTNPLTARHSLALMAQLAVTDASVVEKDLRVNVQIAYSRYDTLKSFDTGSAVKQQQAIGINLDDAYSRVYLARICGACMQVEKKESEGCFWRMLCALALKDPSDMVALEAIKSMAGSTAPQRPTLDVDVIHPHSESQAIKRAKAWTVLSKQTAPPRVKQGEEPPPPPKLLGGIAARVKRALSTNKAPLVCGTCRAVAALAEARARATAGHVGAFGEKTKAAAVVGPLDSMMDMFRELMVGVLEGNHGAAERSLAMIALIWMHKAGVAPVLTPERIYSNVTVGGTGPPSGAHLAGLDPWPRDCLAPVMHALVQAARASPGLITYRIECAMALVHGAPARVGVDPLVDLWRLAVQGRQDAKNAAVASALALLNSTPPPVTSAAMGSSGQLVVHAAAEGAAWIKLQKLAAWWLGENLNAVSGEWTGQSAAKPQEGQAQADGVGPAADSKKLQVTNAEALMREAGRSPVMVTVLDALQRALVSAPWAARVAAAEAMGKVAVRSPEPYRLQCYSVLAGVTKSRGGLSRDVLGVLTVAKPLLTALDELYLGQLQVEGLAKTHGLEAVSWPDAALAELRERHEGAVQRVENCCGKLPVSAGFPLGPTSRKLLTTDVEEERKLKEEAELKKNPDLWKAADGSDSDSELSDREPAPWDRPGYQTAGKEPWERKDEPAPWERDSRPPWEREGEEEQAPWQAAQREPAPWQREAHDADDSDDDYTPPAQRSKNPWDPKESSDEEESAPLPWESAKREPAPWEKYNTPQESSDEEDAHDSAFSHGGGYGYEDTTTVKDEYWDGLNTTQTANFSPSSSFSVGGLGASYDYQPAPASSYDYNAGASDAGGFDYTPGGSDADEPQPPAEPTGHGLIVHEFYAEGDEELTVEVGDEVDLFEETDGWLLCRARDGRMGLVPATYVEVGGRATKGKHRREPTFSDNPWEAEGPPPLEPSFSSGVPAKAGHKREPTFEFEEGPDAAVGTALSTSSFKFDQLPATAGPEEGAKIQSRRGGDQDDRPATVVYGFDAEDPEELTVHPGDEVVVHKEVDGWYTATRLADGTRGLVPVSYVQLL